MAPDGPKLSLTVLAAIGLAACEGKVVACLDFPVETDTDVDSPCLNFLVETDTEDTDVDSPCLDFPVETDTEDTSGFGACLTPTPTPTPDTDTDADSDTDLDSPCLDFSVDTADTELGPCLSPPLPTADTGLGPCLSPPLPTADTGLGPCLSPPIPTADTGVGPCLDVLVDTGDSGVLGPCLSPPIPTALGTAPADFSWTPDEGVLVSSRAGSGHGRELPTAPDVSRGFGACLDVAATGWWPADQCAPADVAVDGEQAVTPRGGAIGRVLASGELPADVAALLEARRRE